MRIWSWRDAVIQSSELKSYSKHILLTLSVYMNDKGQGCYPSIERLIEDTGLARSTLIKYLKEAETLGFIQKKIHGFSGQGWKQNEYIAIYPENIQQTSPEYNKKVVRQTNRLNEKGSLPDEPRHEKGSPSDVQKVVRHTDTNSPLNSDDDNAKNDFSEVEKNDDDDLNKIVKVLGYEPANPLRVDEWKVKGADIDKHIIPAIREAMRRNGGKTASSLKYFDKIVEEFLEKNKPISYKKSKKQPELTALEKQIAKMGSINWCIKNKMFVTQSDLLDYQRFEATHGKVTWNNLQDYYQQNKPQNQRTTNV
ncbi:MAG: helix-turn-helix domain-containing protein [Rickettsiales bacterium]|nr:helix-turn-helix domain-containing protein [Pseudomonadota bacterium]MDA0966863.1 helix-turn-helix domain-containing protein [Pseudomonadota bacterium]MDG4543538.1 helix-turn-helix domain-containing protein [Rickettsiales bacterium]MDG4545686.1 helix-turn-helix domain-containing protein [Rickettsiales bacterium]MDG4547541.1 helix-turn-helix domain-containing protein [Rickettsiales bacterium]